MKRIALTVAALGAVALVGIGGVALADPAGNGSELVSAMPPAAPADAAVPQPAAAPAVPADRAGTIARDRVGGGSIGEIEREGNLWNVEINRDGRVHEVGVDVTTGAVTPAEQGIDDDGDDTRPDIDDDGHGSDDD